MVAGQPVHSGGGQNRGEDGHQRVDGDGDGVIKTRQAYAQRQPGRLKEARKGKGQQYRGDQHPHAVAGRQIRAIFLHKEDFTSEAVW